MCIGSEALASERPTDPDTTLSRQVFRLPPARVPGTGGRRPAPPGRPHAEHPSAGCRER